MCVYSKYPVAYSAQRLLVIDIIIYVSIWIFIYIYPGSPRYMVYVHNLGMRGYT